MCDCITTVQEQLGPDQEIHPAILYRGRQLTERVALPIYRKDTGKLETRRGRPTSFMATFCPFCGVRYEPEAPAPSPYRPESITDEHDLRRGAVAVGDRGAS